MPSNKIKYVLHLADNALIIGQRLGEWCGHGPVLEQDMAMTNIALDNIGRARLFYQYAAELCGDSATEDSLALLRKEHEYLNSLIFERPIGNFADTVIRQFFADAFQYPYFQSLANSADARLAAIAEKAVKEIRYHLKWSSEWVIRLGDGTEISNQKMQKAVHDIWPCLGELFEPSDYEQDMIQQGIAPDNSAIYESWKQTVDRIFAEARLVPSDAPWLQRGGKNGYHTEHFGYLLAELQYMQRAYPGLEW